MPGLVVDLRSVGRRAHIGGKARELARLSRLGLPVPPAWIVPASSLGAALSDTARLDDHISRVLDPAHMYAVRSSADVEDGNARSYAGRFLTVLDVRAEAVAEAIRDVAGSVDAERVELYAHRQGRSATPFKMAVIVQEMIAPRVAGVVFSRNPVTGIKETVIEAVPGTAEDLVAGRVQPERWVRKHGEWLLIPDAPRLPHDVAARIADGAELIESSFGHSIDAEWAWDGDVWWLQARPVTIGTEAAVYSSKMARDMLPGIIVPLVWSVNGPLKCEVFAHLLEDVFGPLDIEPSDLATLFHYRMYINIGALSRLFAEFGFPEESLEMLAGMERGAAMPGMPRPTRRALRRLPRLARSIRRLSRFDRELSVALPRLWERSRAFATEVDPANLEAAEILARMDELCGLVKDVSYHHLVTLMVMQMYTMRLRSRLQKKGVLEKGEPLHLSTSGASPHDVGAALDTLARRALTEDEDIVGLLRAGDLQGVRARSDAADLMMQVDEFLSAFGHLSDSGVNFSAAPWSEQPECVLRMVAAHADALPQTAATEDGGTALGHPDRYGRPGRRAALFQMLRDETSSLYTYAYGQFRPHALALGGRLSELDALGDPGDIFYLTLDEVRRVVAGDLSPQETRTIVRERVQEVDVASQGEPPEVVVGAVAELIRIPGRRVFRGIPSSRGRHTGRVVICRGIADLDRIATGDVVVVPYSDASWTPLFLRAGAIVAESGGLLSHSAILSRELGVPSIVSVRGALAMDDGALVSVDGFEGTVTVLDTA
jgi:phosphohistidine swiveling domain-containing protein